MITANVRFRRLVARAQTPLTSILRCPLSLAIVIDEQTQKVAHCASSHTRRGHLKLVLSSRQNTRVRKGK
jgi:hypothetical protein